ncbi:MAG: class I adenylate cyclase, partial [Pseudomonadota bacterium]
MNINRQRLQNSTEILDARQRAFIEALPLLFHENNVCLPGYVSEATPAGIFEFCLTQQCMSAAESLFQKYKADRRAKPIMAIQGMYFMGSSGSIAFNRHSDFDVWLLHDNRLAPDNIDLIQRKAHAIEKWADENLRLEIHFFVFSAAEFKHGKQQGLSTESSGSAQHYLLLDEFYRSSLLIAGKTPIWWLVPPEYEHQYDDYIQSLIDKNLIIKDDYLDFGSVNKIPAAEFFGAAVWQLYKSIRSPYKSLMKLLLIEVYASEYPNIDVLSVMFKALVYEKIKNIDELDPYLLMYQKVEEYLMIHNQRERLELFRQSFYYKINEPLGNQVKKRSWRRNLFQSMTMDWGWTQDRFQLLDMRKDWHIAEISQQRNRLMNSLTESYRFLSSFARQNTEVSLVSETELNILGRKLYAAFERKSGKIDIINRDNDNILNSSTVTIKQSKSPKGHSDWQLILEQQHQATNIKPVKRAKSVFELIAWAYFNHLVDKHSAFSLYCEDNLTVKELRQIITALEDEFPDRSIGEADFNDLNQNARIQHACLFINVGIIPYEAMEHVSSSRDDVLSYGAKHCNLAVTFDLILSTTWEELLTFHFVGDDALVECISEYTRWYPVSDNQRPVKLPVYSYSSSYGTAITQRIEIMLHDILGHYYRDNLVEKQRYLIMLGDKYYELFNENGVIKNQIVGHVKNLIRNLSRPNGCYSPLIFDKYSNENPLIQTIYQLNRDNRIQIFFLTQRNIADIYIIDENGSLFNQTMPFFSINALIKHYDIFIKSTINRRLFLMLNNSNNIDNIQIEFYSIHESSDRPFRISRINKDLDNENTGFINLQVI